MTLPFSKRIRSYSARAASLKSPIITPRSPQATARLQASYKDLRPQTARGYNYPFTKHHFIDEIEQFLEENLNEYQSEVDRLKVYQQAFDLVIKVFAQWQEPMLKVKEGYDNLLVKIRKDWVAFACKSQEVHRSMSNFRSIVHEKQQKYEKKRSDQVQLMELTKQHIIELKKEIEELSAQINKANRKLEITRGVAQESWMFVQELSDEFQKKQTKRDKMIAKRHNLFRAREEGTQKVEGAHDRIA
jgi:chromosome segregation ATPase